MNGDLRTLATGGVLGPYGNPVPVLARPRSNPPFRHGIGRPPPRRAFGLGHGECHPKRPWLLRSSSCRCKDPVGTRAVRLRCALFTHQRLHQAATAVSAAANTITAPSSKITASSIGVPKPISCHPNRPRP